MLAKDPIPQTMGWFGFAGAEIMFYFPAPFTFRRILKEKSVSGFDHSPYVMSVATNVCWVAYGAVTPGRFQPLLTNAVGGVIEVIYVGIFLKYAKGVAFVKLLRDVIFAVVCLALVLAYSLLLKLPFPNIGGESHVSSFLGVAAAVANSLMYASPLKIISKVIETKSVEFMPMTICIGGLICAIAWTSFAILVGDISIFIPNFIGVLTGFAQMFVYVCYCGNRRRQQKMASIYIPSESVDEKDGLPVIVHVADEEQKDPSAHHKHRFRNNNNTLAEPLLTASA